VNNTNTNKMIGKTIRLAATFWILLTSFLANAQKNAATQEQKLLMAGYLPASKINTFDTSALKYLDRIYYFSIAPDSAGQFFVSPENIEKIKRLRSAMQPSQSLYLVIGGWIESRNIHVMAADPAKKAAYIKALIDFCQLAQLNGVDLDWEDYPQAVNADDYVTLVKEMSTALHEANLPFTVALGVPPAKVELASRVFQYTDQINVMSYGKFDKEGRQATMESFLSWMDSYEKAGIPKEKVLAGMPFYGKHLPIPGDTGRVAISYAEIVAKAQPDISVNQYQNFSYNGIQLLTAKTKWLLQNNYPGIMFWELTQDVSATSNYSLLKAIYKAAFLNKKKE
jgi:chitinase